MKTWFISITVSIAFSVIGLGAISKPGQYDTGSAPQVPGKALVQIVRTWERQSGNARMRVEEMSLGTVIGPHRILTHNHFTGAWGRNPTKHCPSSTRRAGFFLSLSPR